MKQKREFGSGIFQNSNITLINPRECNNFFFEKFVGRRTKKIVIYNFGRYS